MITQSKGRYTAAWVLTGLITFVFSLSALSKILGTQALVEMFEKFGLRNNMLLIGIGELVSGWLFLIPQTNSLGLLLMSAYLGGAIATHMQHSESYIVPAVLLSLVWIAGYLRHSEVLQSFRARVVWHNPSLGLKKRVEKPGFQSTRNPIRTIQLPYDDHRNGLSQ